MLKSSSPRSSVPLTYSSLKVSPSNTNGRCRSVLLRNTATLVLASIFVRISTIMARSSFCSSPLYSLLRSRFCHWRREFSFRNSNRSPGMNKSGDTALFLTSRKPRPSPRRQKKSITYSPCSSSSVMALFVRYGYGIEICGTSCRESRDVVLYYI